MGKQNYSVDLVRQMAECDANYIRLLKLVPQLQMHRKRNFPGQEPAMEVSREQAAARRRDQDEPEKILEGESIEFYIADLEDPQQKASVEITIVEAFRYTATLQIVQKPPFKKWMTNPSMLVRVYHDASTAEVVSYQGHRNFKARYSQPNPRMYHADEKMQVNAFLGEWLTHCLR
ncbi:MAG: DUF1249 domain-containing protein, partial [Pseudomonadales bacterium]